jgi:DNA polymerase-3 subunit epsilon
MNLKLRNALAFFDLETTGIDVMKDRIVEISILKITPDGTKKLKTQRVNPTIPISPEATMVHGIRDEDVKDLPPFKSIAKDIAEFLKGADLAGFNILKFDLPMLVEEMLRADTDFDVSKRKVVDAQKIYHMMEPRTLGAAYKFYCGKDLINAHSAEADTIATFEVLDAQVEKYKDTKIMTKKGEEFVPIKNDVTALHELTASSMIDFAGRMIYDEGGNPIFNFGKHKGKKVIEVLEKEPTYFDWMMENDFPLDTKRKLTELKLSKFKK